MAAPEPVILLTGALGFVGRHVLRQLSARGSRVRLVVRVGQSPSSDELHAVENIISTPDLFLETTDWWARVCDGVDSVIHIAWYAETGKYLESPKNLDCLVGTLRLAQGAARAKVRRFVGVGTCFEYDLAAGTLSIDTPLRPSTPYAAAKAATYMALSQWLPQQKVEFAWCRLFYLYGVGEASQRLVPYLRKRLAAGEPAELTSGTQVRDYLDVREAGQIIAQVALSSAEGPLNICSGTPITVRQLAERIADEYGRRDLLRFGMRPDNLIDPTVVVGVRTELP